MAKNEDVYEVGKSVAKWTAIFSFFIGFAMNFAMAGIIYYGAVLVEDGEITIGDISAFLLYMI